MIVDITDLHCLRITAIRKDMLLDWMSAGLLTPSGFSAAEFYELAAATAAGGSSALVDANAMAELLRAANHARLLVLKAARAPRAPLFAAAIA